MDDSAYREYYWANYATGLGASLHELGHTFDLAHTKTGIMARGFDDIHRVFTVQRNQNTSNEREYRTCSRQSSPRMLSLVDIEGLPNESHTRQYRDTCYGSPFRKVIPNAINGSINLARSSPSSPLLLHKVETDFRQVSAQTSLTMCVKNYDGTETHRTIMQDEGQETVTEVTVSQDGVRFIGERGDISVYYLKWINKET
ncbi:unnamed protein product [Acanthosepion pharaonis]|uniref:Zinc metalloproteinase n=1 Tax=Acanthosepion pharaonis TaxID=158019 RepID=A0A812EEF6_ACAPH|nr:unnamed protein product [Sepia pharaonis]